MLAIAGVPSLLGLSAKDGILVLVDDPEYSIHWMIGSLCHNDGYIYGEVFTSTFEGKSRGSVIRSETIYTSLP